jgi:hypothetical protein
VDTVVAETRVTLDPALLGKNVIVLAFKVGADLAKGGLVVNGIAEAGGVDNGQADAGSLLIELKLDGSGLDAHALFDVGSGWVVVVLTLEHGAAAEGVDKGCPTGAGSAADHEAELDPLLDILLAANLDRAASGRHCVRRGIPGWRSAGERFGGGLRARPAVQAKRMTECRVDEWP